MPASGDAGLTHEFLATDRPQRTEGSAHWWFSNRRSARYSYRHFSESASACSMSAIVGSGIRSWACDTSVEARWASDGSHCSGFHAPLRSSDLGQCG